MKGFLNVILCLVTGFTKRHNILRTKIIFLILAVNSLLYGFAANASNIKNFTKKEYGAANQNWSVDGNSKGFMYFANHRGLLEFDGTSWRLYSLPNKTILRSVLVISDSVIFTGGYRELGYWKTGSLGEIRYHSLNRIAGSRLGKNDEFWNIVKGDSAVYFHSFAKLLVLRDSSVMQVNTPGFVQSICRYNGKILIAVNGAGIYAVEGTSAVPFLSDSRLDHAFIRFLLPYKNGLLIGTATSGIYFWNGEHVQEWNRSWNEYFRKNEVNRAIVDKEGNLIIGTIIDGATVFDRDGQRAASWNTNAGLQNNTILGISCDAFGNIWLALDSGIDFISDDRETGLETENIPGIGSIYDAAIFERRLYLGTNRGLFYKNLDTEERTYALLPETSGQVWNCSVIDNQLLVGFNAGLLLVKNGGSRLISSQSGGFSLARDPLVPGRLIESTYTNMVILEKADSLYRQKGVINGFFDLIRFVECDHLGNIWASHMHRGVYKLVLNEKRDSVVKTEYFGENSPFGKDYSICVFKVANRIVFTTEEKIYTYNDLNDSIIPFHFLNEKLGHFAQAHRIVEAPENHYWFITREKIGLFFIQNADVRLVKSIPEQIFTPHEMINGFENILPLSATEAIVCLENGFARVNAPLIDTVARIKSFMPVLREILLTDIPGNVVKGTADNGTLRVKYKYRNIQLRYAFPHYSNHQVYFQSFMEGIDVDWSEKNSAPLFSFDRLPSGKFVFYVKAYDLWENESMRHELRIEVLPPWYLTTYARIGYVVVFLLFFGMLLSWSIRSTRKKERMRLEKREQELVRLRNEKLRNEVEHKSKELANSTMAIIKKNEFLLKLKKYFSNHKEQLGTRYPDKYYNDIIRKIDENISNQDDWRLFETNFERAHEKFLHKIREQYPDLTPKDLRLCAYLRMNLTSKEIAPLLGVSVRGVENHRYRLRKKMGLEHDDNLIEMILEL